MDLNLLTASGIRALENAGMIEFDGDGIPHIDPTVLDRLDAGDSVKVAIQFVTAPTMATFTCPCCNAKQVAIASATLVMHRCPKRNREMRNMKRDK